MHKTNLAHVRKSEIIEILLGPRVLVELLPMPRKLRHPLTQLGDHHKSFVLSRLFRRRLVRSLGQGCRISLVHELPLFQRQAVTNGFLFVIYFR